ncbi:MAG: Phosphoglycolate phosphatase, plasmid [Candidatus Accumulibacter regalis]|jgi:phosphoglycolate phosphatase|uniref:Phosphoglycolate phosphatase n=1 Tax=Accumulibacter regalis TaxID=522306 RepID=A0A011QIH3_ACCRE|nr:MULTISPECIES: phosphoglycolate phosphatase [unclassified Candidatus Accumulibacter]EXI88845.1 MAG: Phosphoglycolate phosphatase, plasmid [Candidatus Accumulibacter regalis]HRE69723.1 phosphoglycolate phosphatase [Accumulibacter sp.]HRE85059.1 phosphoglycolate phosphatase [Accumulibacter sp.]
MMVAPSLAVRAVLFDLDGTLIDTVLDLHAAADAMLGDLGRPEIPVAAIRSYVGRGIPNLVKRVLAGSMIAADDPAPPPKEALDSFRHHYAVANGRHAVLFPGVREGLEAFQSLGLPLGVITNKAEAFSLPLLEHVGLAPFFQVVVSGDVLPRPKPDPMPLVWASGRLGASPADVLMIGDSVHDFHAGRAAGCHVFLVPYGYNEGREVRDLACDAIVSTLAEAARRVSHA